MLAAADFFCLLGEALPGVAFALGIGFLGAVQFGLQLLEARGVFLPDAAPCRGSVCAATRG